MKFINGNWLPAEGIMPGYAYSIYDYEMSDDKLVFYLAERPGRERGMAISLPYDTETITSPMEGVIRVNLTHFDGQAGKILGSFRRE